MSHLLALIAALVVSMAVIPLMVRLAPRIGMVDLPDARKVHSRPVPRVGGLGIGAGALLSIVLFAPLDSILLCYLAGAFVLVAFGAWDDAHELGHYAKFAGQFIAVVPLVYWGDLWVSHIPFVEQPLPASVGKPFTVFAIIGMINAINHSDGLDGLAGGESLLSLGALIYLAHASGGATVVLIACAVAGGVLGFLRFNTYPARVFMGDAGSQFLGYTLGVLAVLLTQKVNTGLSMAIPVLILGLPVVDILAVFYQRVSGGMHWFRATRNHIHHRLLGLGFDHYQSVLVVYSTQALFAICAIFLCYESDALVLGLYLGACGLVFAALAAGERAGWRANTPGQASRLALWIERAEASGLLGVLPVRFVALSIPAYFLAAGLAIERIPQDFRFALAAIGLTLIVGLVTRGMAASYLVRFATFAMSAFLVYLLDIDAGASGSMYKALTYGYFAALAFAIALAMRFSPDRDLAPTTMDFLMVTLVVVAAVVTSHLSFEFNPGAVIVKTVILFYGCELIISRGSERWNGVLGGSVMTALGVLGLKFAL